jgi:hypothetical protein
MNKPPVFSKYTRMEIIDDILYGVYLPGGVITLEVAKEVVKQRLEYTEGVAYPMLVSGEGLKAVDKEARSYFSKEGSEGIIAGVLLVNSIYTEFFGNFFLKISKPENPSKLFTDKQEALKWLEQYKRKS